MFAGPPYFESYDGDKVKVIEGIWNFHLAEGVIILAKVERFVVGFGCAIPVLKSEEDILGYLRAKHEAGIFPPDLNDVWYMSDVGVRVAYRKHGIFLDFIQKRLLRILEFGNHHYVMRTAAEGSNSRRTYERIGSETIPGVQDVSDIDQVTENSSQSKERVYLFGKCSVALERIAAIQNRWAVA